MRVRAISQGFDNLTVREEGDEFNMPDGAKGSWFVPVDGPVDQPQVKDTAPSGKSHKKASSDLV